MLRVGWFESNLIANFTGDAAQMKSTSACDIYIYLYMNTKSKNLSIIGILDWYLIGCQFFVNVNVLVHVLLDCACPHAVTGGDSVTLCNSPPCWHEPEIK